MEDALVFGEGSSSSSRDLYASLHNFVPVYEEDDMQLEHEDAKEDDETHVGC